MWLLDYRVSTAVWVGIIALVGLAAQTGIVMIVYIDHAYERRKRDGHIHNLNDIIAASMEGTVQRVRPKLMTVSTMLIGLVPLLWATGSGADVMKRIAAPMVGGLITSAFLTLELIPVIYTYWRQEEVLWEKLQPIAPLQLKRFRVWVATLSAGFGLVVATLVARLYIAFPTLWLHVLVATGLAIGFGMALVYLIDRRSAHARVWPFVEREI
jgi:Cu(I)/Ag(I) efflux system membrane protein CusA/SilA